MNTLYKTMNQNDSSMSQYSWNSEIKTTVNHSNLRARARTTSRQNLKSADCHFFTFSGFREYLRWKWFVHSLFLVCNWFPEQLFGFWLCGADLLPEQVQRTVSLHSFQLSFACSGACVRQSNGDEACLCGVGHFGNDCSRGISSFHLVWESSLVAAVSEGSNGGVVVVVIVAFLLVGGALLALFIYLKFKHHLVCVMDGMQKSVIPYFVLFVETNSSDSETEAILRIEEVIEETDEPTEPFDLRLPEEKTGMFSFGSWYLLIIQEMKRKQALFWERQWRRIEPWCRSRSASSNSMVLTLSFLLFYFHLEVKKNVPMKKEEDSMAIDHIIKGDQSVSSFQQV